MVADWDTALAAAFERCESRRYTTYWTQVGEQGEQAARLIALRQAEVLPIEDADTFFTELAAKATALDEDARAGAAGPRGREAGPQPSRAVDELHRPRGGSARRDRAARLEPPRHAHGHGGTGKTRLALQVGAEVLDRYPDGVWFTTLAAVEDPSLVAREVASAFDVGEGVLIDTLRDRRLLLVVDNCEHVLDRCATLVHELLEGAAGVDVLATSREALGIPGEVIHQIAALTVPPSAAATPGLLTTFDAVRLFVDRAAAVQTGFAITDRNAEAVAEITRHLDGIPLAIELAAARVRVLPPEQIAARLDDRFRLLTSGSRTALPRQQTLRAAIDWSYDLLSEPEQDVFKALSVFRGSFTLDATESVGATAGIESYEVLDLLAQLVDKSMERVVEPGVDGAPRYSLLETLRDYSDGKLESAGMADDARDRHAKYFLELGTQAETQVRTGTTRSGFRRWRPTRRASVPR